MKFVTKIFLTILLLNLTIYKSKKLKEQESTKNKKQTPINKDNIKVFQIDETKNNSVINVLKNVTFYIDVKANPSTGYDLYLKNYDNLDKKTIQLTNLVFDNSTKMYMSNVFNRDPIISKEKNLGFSGYYKFEVKAIGNFSSTDLEFVQVRPSDPKNYTRLTKVSLINALKPEFSMKLTSSAINFTFYYTYYILILLIILF